MIDLNTVKKDFSRLNNLSVLFSLKDRKKSEQRILVSYFVL